MNYNRDYEADFYQIKDETERYKNTLDAIAKGEEDINFTAMAYMFLEMTQTNKLLHEIQNEIPKHEFAATRSELFALMELSKEIKKDAKSVHERIFKATRELCGADMWRKILQHSKL